MAKFTLSAEARSDQGKGASRRLRRTDRVPGVLYGGHKDPLAVTFRHNDLFLSFRNEAIFSSILTIKLPDGEQQAILKDVQRHPVEPRIMHIDLQRVSENEEIRVHVPLHFLNESTSKGVKDQGGVVSRNMIEVEIACLPRHLPEYIEVDVKPLEINQSIHMSDLKLPEGVRIPALNQGKEHDLPVVAIHHMRVTTDEDLATTAAPTATEVSSIQDEKAAAKAAADGTAAPAKPGEAKPAAAAPAADKGGDKKK
jgi:large subunit ribosomal protein L25